jgi:hypothetical protein
VQSLTMNNLLENAMSMERWKKYFMTLIDESTRCCYVYLLKSKYAFLNYFNKQ